MASGKKGGITTTPQRGVISVPLANAYLNMIDTQWTVKEGAMKRIVILAVVLVTMLVSIGGCWVGWDVDGRGGRGGGHDREVGHNAPQGHQERR
jgi:hypothetical protein